MSETWKAVDGYEGLYEVSDHGRVRSLDKTIVHSDGRVRTYKGRVLRERFDTKGYVCVVLCHKGEHSYKKVHRLVATAFIPNPDNLPFVNHKDETKHNNRVDNLEWCTGEYNSNYGTVQQRRGATLKNGVKSIPVIATLPDGTEEYYPSMAEFGRVHNKPNSEGAISAVVNGKQKSAYGRMWRKAE